MCVSFPWLEFSGLVLQAAERLFNFALCLCAWVCGQAASPPPPSGGRENFRVGRRFFWSTVYIIVK